MQVFLKYLESLKNFSIGLPITHGSLPFPQARVARSVWTRLGNTLTVNAEVLGFYLMATEASGLFLRRAKFSFQEHNRPEEGRWDGLSRRTIDETFFFFLTHDHPPVVFSFAKKELKTISSPSVVGSLKALWVQSVRLRCQPNRQRRN